MTFSKGVALVSLAICALAIPTAPHAQTRSPQAGLAAGISQTRAGDFVTALVTLNEVVSQLAARPEESRTIARAHAFRAVAFIGLEQPDWARAAALQALAADPLIVVTADEFGANTAALFDAARRAAREPEAVGDAAAAAGRFQDAFLAYLSAIRALPQPAAPAVDQRLREKIVGVVNSLEAKPTVPEEARTLLGKADALLATAVPPGASSDQPAAQAAVELRKVVRLAPWWPEALIKLSIALQRTDQRDEALFYLNLYESASPDGGAIADVPTTAGPPPAVAASAVIHVYFPKAARGVGVRSKVLCDGQPVADLAHGRFITLTASPGFHLIEFKGRKTSGTFQAAADHYVRIGIEGYPAHFALHITEPGKATKEIQEKQLVANEPAKTFSAECGSAGASQKPVRR
jgi:tetratricopeptide (TPR) repeat protein